jgi:hypothetical protein
MGIKELVTCIYRGIKSKKTKKKCKVFVKSKKYKKLIEKKNIFVKNIFLLKVKKIEKKKLRVVH